VPDFRARSNAAVRFGSGKWQICEVSAI
jgi:hypothetical protein